MNLPTAFCLFLGAWLPCASHAQPPVPQSPGSGDLRQAYETFRHQVKPERDGWSARNPGQRWNTAFDARGFLATPDTGSWTWGLELTGYGTAGGRDGEASTRAIAARAAVSFAENRIHYAWDDTLTEWFLNDSRGLEQGWTLSARPGTGEGPLQLTLRTRGPLHPAAGADPRQMAFIDAAGSPVLTYGGLKAWDADGVPLDTHFEIAPNQLSAFRIVVEDAAARYPVTIDPLAQQAYLKATNNETLDQFGEVVALSGNTALIGARKESSAATGVNGNQASNAVPDSGAAYVFVRNGSTWSQQAYLKASNTGSLDVFGASVSISGSLVAIGAALDDSAAVGVNGDQSSDAATDSGAVYVFGRLPLTNSWSQRAYIKASNTGAGDGFGRVVALSGNTLVVGAVGENSSATGVNGGQTSSAAAFAGAAYVFTSDVLGFSWSQQAYLKASNTGAGDRFGRSVALSGDILVVGADAEDSGATGINGSQGDDISAKDSGAAYVYTRVGTSWRQQAYLKPSHSGTFQYFGNSVAISGDTVMVGAWGDGSSASGVNGDPSNTEAPYSGAAHVFTGFAPPPLRMTGIQSVRNPNGTYTVTITGSGQPVATHSLQSSPAMAPDTWLGVGTTTTDAEGRFTFGPFVEPASRNRYFYRVEAN